MRTIETRDGVRILLAAALVGTSALGCMGGAEPPARTLPPAEVAELPLLQLLEGEFDGQEFTFRTVERDRVMEVGQAAGVSVEALSSLSSCAGSMCTGSYVYLANGASVFQPTWTDTAHCGTSPSGTGGNLGVCRQIVVRNTYTSQLERVYIRFSSLTPSGNTTAVSFPAAYPYSASVDFGVSAPGVTNGLRRIGELPASQTSGGQAQFWSFTGTTTDAALAFRFVVEVYAAQATPTATIVASGATASAVSEDGTRAVYAASGTGGLIRRNLTTGTNDTAIGAGCTITTPHLSGDGGIATFVARGSGCTLPGISASLTHVYIHDYNTATTTLVSHADGDPSTAGDGNSASPRISGDGTAVVYQSSARNLTFSDPGRACVEVYRYDVGGDFNEHVSGVRGNAIGTDWVTGSCAAAPPGVSADINRDGSLIVFSSASALETSDTNANCDAYVYDHGVAAGLGVQYVYRVSLAANGSQLSGGLGNATCLSIPGTAISADGAYVAFPSGTAITVTQNVGNGTTTTINVPTSTPAAAHRHIYLRSSAEGDNNTLQLVTHTPGTAGSPTSQTFAGSTGTLGTPVISSDGRFVAIVTSSQDMAAQAGSSIATSWPGSTSSQLFVCDMQAVDTSVHRCFVASASYSGATPSFQSSAPSSSIRPSLAYSDSTGTGYVGYQVGTSAFVSPVGDPRYQQNDFVN